MYDEKEIKDIISEVDGDNVSKHIRQYMIRNKE